MEKANVIIGLKCDNKSCDYGDDTPSTDYENHIGRPCPKCGESLLTEADYKAFVKLQKVLNHPIIRGIDKLGKLFGRKTVQAEFKFNGTGKIDMEVKK